jgi:hypothetical protein
MKITIPHGNGDHGAPVLTTSQGGNMDTKDVVSIMAAVIFAARPDGKDATAVR